MVVEKDILFINAETNWDVTLLDKLEYIFNEYMGDKIQKDDRVLLKVHFGQSGNMASFRPSLLRKLVDLIKEKGGIPALGETTGLGYGFFGRYGGRGTGTDYIQMAAAQGFTMGTMNAPICILDGELGVDTFTVEVKGDKITQTEVARGALHFDHIIVFSHAKGHPIGGFGGAIKNLGIGMVGKKGKGLAHFGADLPKIDPEKCIGEKCQKCLGKCPVRCLEIENNVAKIVRPQDCVLCSHCSSVCKNVAKIGAIKMGWVHDKDDQARRFAENANGVMKGLNKIKMHFFNAIVDTSPMCDCVNHTPYRMTPDIGILACKDPVAIDQASIDLINKAPNIAGPNTPLENIAIGEDKIAYAQSEKDKEGNLFLCRRHIVQLEVSEALGTGVRTYKLREIEIPKKK